MSQVITFYSFKGGVGRTMALANIAVLLSQWGYKTLMIDWDLEAPGLENFFKDYIDIGETTKKKGLIDILTAKPGSPISWRDLLIPFTVKDGKQPLHLLAAGDRSNDYFNKVRNFDVNVFYEEKDGGNLIENLRQEWKDAYDFVLVDSRTGITDNGGICTIQLPDTLVLLFTATDMGFNGILDVAERAVKSQQKLPFDRMKLVSLPVPARFDTLTEFKKSQEWLDKFSERLTPIYNDWLPLSVDPRKFLELTKIPYIPYFSFGEKLPVIEQGVNDPSGLGYAYATLAALIANNFDSIEELINKRNESLEMAIKKDDTPVTFFVSYADPDKEFKDELVRRLSSHKMIEVAKPLSKEQIPAGLDITELIREQIYNSQIVFLIISQKYLNSGFITRLTMPEIEIGVRITGKLAIPIILDKTAWQKIDFLIKRKVLPTGGKPFKDHAEEVGEEQAFTEIVQEIEKAVQYIRNKKSTGE